MIDEEEIIVLYVELEKAFGKQSHEMEQIHLVFKEKFPDVIYDSMRL